MVGGMRLVGGFSLAIKMDDDSSRHDLNHAVCFHPRMDTLNMHLLTRNRANQHRLTRHKNRNLLQLLIQIPSALMESNHTRNTHCSALQVRHTSRDPVGAHAHGCKTVDSRFSAQVVDLRGRGIELEEGVVDGAWDGAGEGVHGLRAVVTVDGGDGGGDHGGPFCVGVAVCHFCCCVWGGWG